MLNILQYDPYLEPYKEDLSYRLFEFSRTKKRLLGMEGKLTDFANGHKYFGFQQEKSIGLSVNGRLMLKKLFSRGL